MRDYGSFARESRTPTLDTYITIYRHYPDMPEIARIIDRGRKIIFINLSARPGAKIDLLKA